MSETLEELEENTMGEARNRGTESERTEQAIERKEAINNAIVSREHAAGLVWMAIESANSVPITDGNGAFVVGEDGKMRYGPNEDTWESMHPDDIPEWIKQNGLIGELKNGVQVCSKPGDGGRWFRGVICTPPNTSEETH